MSSNSPAHTSQTAPQLVRQIALAVHGGAGTIRRAEIAPELDAQYRTGLTEALAAGWAVLTTGGSSLDAVEAAVRVLEDSPLFNAGKGATLTSEGRVELDASIMDGRSLRAGAVGAVARIRNPIRAARAVMEQTPHVLLVGEAADDFAREAGLEIVSNDYFVTERRRKALEDAQRRQRERERERRSVLTDELGEARSGFFAPEVEGKYGTVGSVALDRQGNLAAATSTGGMTNKRAGRVGDTPIIGAGNYAQNATCAISTTGQGEFFMRLVTGADLAARVRYLKEGARDAAVAQMQRLSEAGGRGGLIALDGRGQISLLFNSEGMYRGVIDAQGQPRVALYADERIPGDHERNGGPAWGATGF